MKLWLRINGLEFSSWYIVYEELITAFRNIGIEIYANQAEYPHNISEHIEIWWGDPEFWMWSDKKVRLRVGIALSEHRSLFTNKKQTVIRNINQCDVLFCPSNAAMQAYLEAPIEVPIYLMPFGVNTTAFPFCSRNFEEAPFRFLHLGVTQFRKGSWLACDAFIRAFSRNDDVKLTVASYRNSPMYKELLNEYSNHPQMDFQCRKTVSSLTSYKSHHVLVSPHLSEGFGLCIPEAMATGMPCIVARCSAPREYFSKEYGWWAEMSELYSPVSQCYPGISGLWRIPDVNSLAEQMKYAYKNRADCEEKGKMASDYIFSNMTWERSVAIAVKVIARVL